MTTLKTAIKLHNTMTRTKEEFVPIDADNVRMYVCGPTVYDRAHLGNARPVVVFDVLYRLLRHVYGPEHVTYVRNFTDVDDKINARAAESGRSIAEITGETTQWFLDDMAAVGALEPDHMPRATQFIPQMVTMIEELIAGGHAYAAEGHVLFAVDSYKAYGRLSGRTVDDMIAGARVEVAPYKRNPMDFVLWKPSTDDLPGWDGPVWEGKSVGRGRPGWHIECSAMSYELLGESFDIHGGGNDLMFPHHENEIAQSCCVHPKGRFANVWMHNEMLQVEGKKMSKSLGNFFTVRELLEQGVPGEVIRFVFLSTHYRKPMDWTEKKANEAKRTLEAWFNLVKDSVPENVFPEVLEFLANDLNTSAAIGFLKSARYSVIRGDATAGDFLASAKLLGLEIDKLEWPRNFENEKMQNPNQPGYGSLFEGVELMMIARPDDVSPNDASEIAMRISLLWAAKQKQLYDFADEIRVGLVEAGVKLQESKSDVRWEPTPTFSIARLPELPSPPPLSEVRK